MQVHFILNVNFTKFCNIQFLLKSTIYIYIYIFDAKIEIILFSQKKNEIMHIYTFTWLHLLFYSFLLLLLLLLLRLYVYTYTFLSSFVYKRHLQSSRLCSELICFCTSFYILSISRRNSIDTLHLQCLRKIYYSNIVNF